MIKFSWIGILIFVLVPLIKLIIKIHKKNSKKTELAMHAEDKLREDALDQYILNPSAPPVSKETVEAKPFEVSYDASNVERVSPVKGKSKKKPEPKIMVQLIENSELSSRKYMLDPSAGINIGSRKGKNDIVVADTNVDSVQCNIIESNNKIYVRNMGGSGKLVLSRAGQRAFVEKKAIEIKTADLILLGKTVFRIELVKTNL